MVEFRRHEGLHLPFDPIQCSWSQVVMQMRNALDAAGDSEQADAHFFTRQRRKLANITRIIEPMMDAIPDDLCYLHGGLALLFFLIQTREKIRRDILDVFIELPGVLTMADKKSRYFCDDVNLHSSIEDLKLTLFQTIPALIHILRPGTICENPGSRIAAPFRSFKAEDLLGQIRKKTGKVETVSRNLQDDIALKTFHYAESIHEMSATAQQHNRDIDLRILMLQRSLDQQRNDAINVQNGMFQMLTNFVSQYFVRQADMGPAAQLQMLPEPPVSSAAKREALLGILEVPEQMEAKDLKNVVRQNQAYDMASKSYGAMILSSRQFSEWFNSNDPEIVYIEGQLDSTQFGKTSPISYFCGNLAEALRVSGRDVVLRFFCGQHTAFDDRLGGPRGLIRALLAQLLRLGPTASLDEVSLEGFQGTHDAITMDELCRLFTMLIDGFPAHMTIFCIIDGLSHLEGERWRGDYGLLLEALDTIWRSSGLGARVKVLVTSPTRSRSLPQNIPPERQIRVTDRGSRIGERKQANLWEGLQER
ncbi:hypothetical protein GQ53DRAFT_739674 [Thozetella sp. PMI_491]|nr:hypothetical protein GQ53DRAFT_739674 [Thozetella sp. PMI_491]